MRHPRWVVGRAPTWHALLGQLPAGAVPRRKPVASPEVLGTPTGAAITGWEEVILELSAGAAGLRVVQVLVDGTGHLLSASDHVLYRLEDSEGHGPARIHQESIGGRFEADGTFRGTCWQVRGPEPTADEKPDWEMTPREASTAEGATLRALVTELLGREREN